MLNKDFGIQITSSNDQLNRKLQENNKKRNKKLH